MRARFVIALAALLALPACLDPIVGTQCAKGYSACGHKCVRTGSCTIRDAGEDVDGEETSNLDAISNEAGTSEAGNQVDAGGQETSPVVDGGSIADTDQAELGLGQPDSASQPDLAPQEDTVPQEDASLPDGEMAPDDVPWSSLDGGPAGLDGPEYGAGDAEEVSNSPDSGQAELDGTFSADETGAVADLGADDATSIDVPAGDSLLCVGCQDGGDASDDETGLVFEDGGTDATRDDAATGADAEESDATGEEAGPLVCPEPKVACNDQCVDLTSDPENCGSCNTMCTSGVCLPSGCLVCATEETICGQQCINTASDPDNCGGCNVPCASGLCSNNQCEASGTGRVTVIGHDYLKNRPAMNRILGNAVFLWPVNPVNLLTYTGAANPTAVAGANGAIAQVAAATGRQFQRTDVAAGDVPTQLPGADVFLVYGQEGADDATLTQLGQDWTIAMTTFVNRGGTIIILDGFYPGNSGTVQILSQTGLFSIQHNASATNDVCTVVARGDALATGLPRTYRCEQNSVTFAPVEAGASVTSVVVSGTPGIPVVVDKVF